MVELQPRDSIKQALRHKLRRRSPDQLRRQSPGQREVISQSKAWEEFKGPFVGETVRKDQHETKGSGGNRPIRRRLCPDDKRLVSTAAKSASLSSCGNYRLCPAPFHVVLPAHRKDPDRLRSKVRKRGKFLELELKTKKKMPKASTEIHTLATVSLTSSPSHPTTSAVVSLPSASPIPRLVTRATALTVRASSEIGRAELA